MPELTIASWNVHWGRSDRHDAYAQFDLVDACGSLEADVLVLQETWAPDGEIAQHDAVGAALGLSVVSVPLSRSVLHPKPGLTSRADPERATGEGDWCLALLSRKPIRTTRVVEMPPLRVDPSSRVLLLAEVDVDGTNLTVVGTHFSHLEFGSPLHTRALRRALPPADRPGVLLGDMNMWGWTVSAMVPTGWRRSVRGKTWPSRRPRHQIDHILVTPSVEVIRADVLPHVGSDHRAVRARLRVQ
jgi:endonuclease/exonuclease/phosphatase family metal-dependent hydrolase